MDNTVVIQGGLGNQMFQYAFAKALGDNTFLDVSWFHKSYVVTPRKLGLLEMRTSLRYESAFRNRALSGARKVFSALGIKKFYPNIYESHLIDQGGNAGRERGRYIGYFQDERWFKHCRESLLKDFLLRERICPCDYVRYENEMLNTESVAVHVRRGDYLNPAFGWFNLPFEYYRDAIAHIGKSVSKPLEIFWFSDDSDFVKKALIPYLGGKFVDVGGGAAADLMLMKSCRHNVIANSSFSWWGAWLNENPGKTVVAPARWNVNVRYGAKVPAEWHVI